MKRPFDIRIEVGGQFKSATAIGVDQKLPLTTGDNSARQFTLPRVGEYEVVVLR